MKKQYISPSILAADFARLGEETQAVLDAGADFIHFDVMDNHFVSNLTIGPMVCAALRNYGIIAPIDVHLMVQPVDDLIVAFAKAGATYITFHPEASHHPHHSIRLIKAHHCYAGMACSPDTNVEILEPYLSFLDMVLVMSVYPGFGGQSFIPKIIQKIQCVRKQIDTVNKNILLSVDGGINIDNIQTVARAGADVFVAGTAIFNTHDYVMTINQFRKKLNV